MCLFKFKRKFWIEIYLTALLLIQYSDFVSKIIWFSVILITFNPYIWSKVVNFDKLTTVDDRGLIRRQIANRIRFKDKKSEILTWVGVCVGKFLAKNTLKLKIEQSTLKTHFFKNFFCISWNVQFSIVPSKNCCKVLINSRVIIKNLFS